MICVGIDSRLDIDILLLNYYFKLIQPSDIYSFVFKTFLISQFFAKMILFIVMYLNFMINSEISTYEKD